MPSSARSKNVTCFGDLGSVYKLMLLLLKGFLNKNTLWMFMVYAHSFFSLIFYSSSWLPFLLLSSFSYFLALRQRESTMQCVKYLSSMVCPAWHKQNIFCHLSHCVYASLINRLVPDRQAKALACVWILFSNASATDIPNEHLDHIALQGKVANCTFQVGLYGVHS